MAVSPPLAMEAGPPGSESRPTLILPTLILENHHPWWSFCRWNRRHGAYRCVVYGAGAGFGEEALRFLADLLTEEASSVGSPPELQYVGDLDIEGLKIPWRAAPIAAGLGMRLLPAERWYRRMLERAEALERSGLSFSAEPGEVGAEIAWLPEPLQMPVRRRLAAGRRVPQEILGTEELTLSTREGER